jgi:hypothetical protein
VCVAVIAVLVAIVALGVAAGGSGPKHTIKGTLTIAQTDSANSTIKLDADGTCTGYGRDGRITATSRVVLKDAKGATIATAPLGSGSTQELDSPSTTENASSGMCTFSFEIPGVSDSDQYVIDVAGIPIRRTEKQLREDEWSVHVDADQH